MTTHHRQSPDSDQPEAPAARMDQHFFSSSGRGDSRRYPRVRGGQMVEVEVVSPDRALATTKAMIKDHSRCGMGLFSPVTWTPDQLLRVTVPVSWSSRPVPMLGKVRWSRVAQTSGVHEIGLQFIGELPPGPPTHSINRKPN